jgi:hypothetical protein
MTQVKTPIDTVGLKAQLSKLTLDELKVKFEELGISSAYKNGANKAALVDKGVKAYVELQNSISETPVVEPEVINPEIVSPEVLNPEVEETIEDSVKEIVEEQVDELDTIPEGEYDIDEDTLGDYPELVKLGYQVGDTLIVDADGKWTREVSPESPEFGTIGITTRKTPEEADAEIKEANKDLVIDETSVVQDVPEDSLVNQETVEQVVEETTKETSKTGEYVPEVIDESKFTIEELEENILICEANCKQALPETRVFLLRKVEALQAALDRKRK